MIECVAAPALSNTDPQIVMDVVLQPIVSVARRQIVGFEGLSRGYRCNGSSVQIQELFTRARDDGTILEFDRGCRERCMQRFSQIEDFSNSLYLFVNLDTSILDIVSNTDYLFRQARRHNLLPQQVVIEINESNAVNTERLVQFSELYKQHGFLIALDDIGAGYSNLERLAIVKPDIVKLDRSLIDGIESNYYKQEIFKSMVHMASKIGAIVVAEGVETMEQANAALEFGAHLLQGYLFSRPMPVEKFDFAAFQRKIDRYASLFSSHIRMKINQEKQAKRKMDTLAGSLARSLCKAEMDGFTAILHRFADKNADSSVECVYVLNRVGLQVSDTVFLTRMDNNRKGMLFFPAAKGSNHELKPYYYEMMNAGMTKYISSAYISHASGNVCETYTRLFHTLLGEGFILCMDILQQGNESLFLR